MAKPRPTLTALREEYDRLFQSAIVSPAAVPAIEKIIAKMLPFREKYEYISWHLQNKIPWYWIGCIHNMECGLREVHLHNGDPLTARTKQVPAGRPAEGEPPFLFEDSGVDALRLKKLDTWTDWSIAAMLFKLEEYNGWGYRMYHPETLSPYLWAGTNHYVKGKYVADGKWDPNAVSKQIGCAAILKQLKLTGRM